MRKTDDKFRVKADLAMFQAIQQDGRLSEQSIAQITDIPPTTVHYAMQRIRQRDFFRIKAVPKLEKFREIPMAVIGFSHVNPMRIHYLRNKYAGIPEVIQLLHSEKDILLYVMDAEPHKLSERLFGIMEELGEKPCLYMRSPNIAKSDMIIPDRILNAVYGHLPGRGGKI
ncbi:winged helix-turn-helix transcriptional regulator [Candidatus Poribacteria bacterium]|nr:winged helix-turn-helix transcriptional regulator [Candidatus Poribacteria bacterium]